MNEQDDEPLEQWEIDEHNADDLNDQQWLEENTVVSNCLIYKRSC